MEEDCRIVLKSQIQELFKAFIKYKLFSLLIKSY